MSLIDQDEDVGIGERLLDLFDGRGKLVDDGSDDGIGITLQQFYQSPTCGGVLHLFAAFAEGLGDLVVQVGSVGDQHDAWVVDAGLLCDFLGQHYHGQRFAAALRMPYHTPVSVPGFDALHAFDGFFHGEKLLIASQLFDTSIEDGEVKDEFQ